MRSLTMRKLIFAAIILCTTVISVFGNPISTYNHSFNPALLGVRTRGLFELGGDLDFGFGNTSMPLGDVLSKEIVIDFNKIADDLNGNNFSINMMASTEGHLALTLFGISFGTYSDFNSVVSIEVPNLLFDFMANGNTLNESISDASNAYARVFYETGLYGGYRWNDYQFGAKLGAFSPLLYSGSDAEFTTSFETSTTPDTATQTYPDISANAHLSMPFYSVVDLSGDNAVTAQELLSGLNGINVSFGAIKVRKNKAMYGVSLTGLTVVPAQAKYKSELTMDASIEIDNIAGNLDSDDDWITDNIDDPEFTTSEEGKFSVSTPIQLGGFYRLTGFPFFIDWIGHAQFTFDDEIQYGAGITAEGAFFPFSWFSLGMEYDRVLWKTVLGMKANLHVFEIGMDMGLAGPGFVSMLTGNGLYGKLYMAFGF